MIDALRPKIAAMRAASHGQIPTASSTASGAANNSTRMRVYVTHVGNFTDPVYVVGSLLLPAEVQVRAHRLRVWPGCSLSA